MYSTFVRSCQPQRPECEEHVQGGFWPAVVKNLCQVSAAREVCRLSAASRARDDGTRRRSAEGSAQLHNGVVLSEPISALDQVPPGWFRDQDLNVVVVVCAEDEARWEAERLAAFTRQVAQTGTEVYLAPWGYGKVLDPDPVVPSLYLHTHPQTLQVDSRGRRCPRACPNDPRFLEWFSNSMRTLAWLMETQGFVWETPRFFYGRGTWACRCTYCQRLFSAAAGEPLPRQLTPEVLEFRRHSLNMFLLAAAAAVQSVDRRLKSIVVPPAPLDPATVTTGADDWRVLAGNSGTETLGLAVSPQPPALGLPPPEHYAESVVSAQSQGKGVWLWLETERLTPETVNDARTLARQLSLEAIIWSDYDQLRRSSPGKR